MKILVANPAENITVFVLEPVDDPAERAALTKAILAERSLRAEQVGFVIPPENSASGLDAGLWRLEMAGGELCGNAARSFGLYVARVLGFERRATVLVSVSGADAPVPVDTSVESSRATAEIPIPAAGETLLYEGRPLPMLVFKGITHIIAPDVKAGRETFFALKKLYLKKISRSTEFPLPETPPWCALGVMFYETAPRFLRPAVYVRSTDSLVFESSCGSGSAALGVWFSRELQNGTASYFIAQPGGIIGTKITKKAGEITRIIIEGEVKLGEPLEYPL